MQLQGDFMATEQLTFRAFANGRCAARFHVEGTKVVDGLGCIGISCLLIGSAIEDSPVEASRSRELVRGCLELILRGPQEL